MHADLSRFTFRPERHYSAVVAQQGRVQLDADANEQTAIQLHQARTLAADLIGQHGGPRDAAGFRIEYVGGKQRAWTTCPSAAAATTSTASSCDATRPAPGVPVPDEATRTPTARGGATARRRAARLLDLLGPARRLPRPGEARRPAALARPVAVPGLPEGVGAARSPRPRTRRCARSRSARRCPDTAARAKVVWQVLPLSLRRAGDRGDRPVQGGRPRGVRQVGAEQAAPAARARRPQRAARPRRRGPLPGQARTPATAGRRTSSTGSRCTTAASAEGRHLQVVPGERLGGLPRRRTRRHLGGVGVPRAATTSWT